MRRWSAERVAREAGARLLAAPVASDGAAPGPSGGAPGPSGVSIDSRTLRAGELFVGLRGTHSDGGSHARAALAAGAWGALVEGEHAADAAGAVDAEAAAAGAGGAVLAHEDPLAGLQALARGWRRELGAHGAKIVAITGSTGKTSTKDILAALLATRLRSAASPGNLNTEIGLPLALLAAPADVEVVVLEMAMRGAGQIAELTAIAEPDVGVIVNVGPAHLELLGSLEAIAAAKAELIAGMAPGTSVVVPAGEALLSGHLRSDLQTISFGEDGDVTLLQGGSGGDVLIDARGEQIRLRPSFHEAHNLRNLLAAVAAASALGVTPAGELEVRFSGMRGQRVELADGIVVIDDCYNANPMSMRAAIDELATASGRRVAVLGEMLELGPGSRALHREIGAHAGARGIGLVIGVGELAGEIAAAYAGEAHAAPDAREAHTVPDARAAAELLPGLLHAGDTVLVKGSRGVGLELVTQSLLARAEADVAPGARPLVLAPGAGPERR